MLLPVHYAVTPQGTYSDGIHASVCYVSVAFYLVLCVGLLMRNWSQIHRKKKFAIGAALAVEVCVCLTQAVRPTWLISGMGLPLMTLSFYLTLENPDILRAELTECKMSMLYLKSQVNPHFLYNTLDTIRIQAQLNGDKAVADLLMRLVDFFRLSVKVDRRMVALDDELELLEAYTELMCCRYPELQCEYDIDPNLGSAQVPNFILQPIVDNSLLQGYRRKLCISAQKTADSHLEIQVMDTGSGFEEGKKEAIGQMLLTYARQAPKLEGNSNGGVGTDRHSPSGYRHHGYQHPHEGFGACIDSLKIPLFQQKLSSVQEPEAREERTIAGITRYLQEHLAEEVSLSVPAEVFHLNPQYIRQLFRSEIGVNFLTCLTNICMENAKSSCSPRPFPLRR